MKNEEIILKKIELKSFLDTLIEVYNSGIDYIDIIAVPGMLKDSITIVERMPSEEQTEKPLSEEDINHLSSI
jgi:hypothetical protein